MSSAFKIFRENVPITLIGLPNAGKTTFVLRLKDGRFHRPKPTIGVSFERIKIGDVDFTVFDLSGQKAFRKVLWQNYVQSSYGIIFMLDSADLSSLRESKKWFWTIIDEWLKGILADRVVLFVANKADLKASLPLDAIIEKLDLVKVANYPNISFQIFKTSLRTGENIDYAVNWFVSKLRRSIEKLVWMPEDILISDSAGNIIYSLAKSSEINSTDLAIGYLKALSKFSDELLGETNIKIVKTEHWYSVIIEEKNYLVSLFVKNDEFLAEARRIGLIIMNYMRENKWKVSPDNLEKFISQLFVRVEKESTS